MIKNQNRSGWIGASDTYKAMMPFDSKTFRAFWLEKLGVTSGHFRSKAMMAGSWYEHRILDQLGIKRRDRQIRLRPLRLRVNLDGEDRDTIYEVKTYGGEAFKVSPAYWRQAQAEMFAARKKLVIVAYRLLPEDYENYFNPIDLARISFHPVEYDPDWVRSQYCPRLLLLADFLRKGAMPCEGKSAGFNLVFKASSIYLSAYLRMVERRMRP